LCALVGLIKKLISSMHGATMKIKKKDGSWSGGKDIFVSRTGSK
jgi:hypothetical protein